MRAALLAVLLVGCWTGPERQGFYRCSADAECPDGWVCVSTAMGGRCFDSSIDAGIVRPDTGPAGACDPATHGGCFDDELCCGSSGALACVLGTVTACEGCGTACGTSADRCASRSCRCGSEAPCSGTTAFCVSGACEACADPPCTGDECATNDDCPEDRPACDAGDCRLCSSAADCPTERCVGSGPLAGQCAECDPSDDSGCADPTPVCDDDEAVCVGCQVDEDCDPTEICVVGTCETCDDISNRGCDAPLVCVDGDRCGQCDLGIECPDLGFECNVFDRCECTSSFGCDCGADTCTIGESCDTVSEICILEA